MIISQKCCKKLFDVQYKIRYNLVKSSAKEDQPGGFMITEFSIDVEESDEVPTINVSGEVDIYTCGELRQVIKDTLEKGSTTFILNFQNIHYIDSTGLGTIAHSAQQVEEKNGVIYVICSKPQIKKIFEVSGLQKKNIELFENVSDVPVGHNVAEES